MAEFSSETEGLVQKLIREKEELERENKKLERENKKGKRGRRSSSVGIRSVKRGRRSSSVRIRSSSVRIKSSLKTSKRRPHLQNISTTTTTTCSALSISAQTRKPYLIALQILMGGATLCGSAMDELCR